MSSSQYPRSFTTLRWLALAMSSTCEEEDDEEEEEEEEEDASNEAAPT